MKLKENPLVTALVGGSTTKLDSRIAFFGQADKLSCHLMKVRSLVKETELKSSDSISGIRKICGTIVNIIWFPIGVILAIAYIVSGIISFITVVGIPAGIVYVRSAKFVIWPIGAKCVSKKQAYAAAVANEIEKRQQ
jgi:uncharacterized membrane protein YccF (DUF307 family)